MKAKDVISLLGGAIGKANEDGVQAIQVSALLEYVERIRKQHEEDERRGPDAEYEGRMERFRTDLNHWLEQQKYQFQTNLELLRSTVQAGQSAIRSCLAINGGASVALLAFAGHIATNPGSTISLSSIASALWPFAAGVLAAGFTAGFTYLAQYFFSDTNREKTARWLNVVSILLGLSSLGLFGFGAWNSYLILR